ncbi:MULTISPECIES: hypothetical protein [Bradyrhizobium]|jgi:hypothetical protein|nr:MULTISPECIES: hypothetical protein [Bradyrhizobium]MCS3446132.1 hypothetical protein [Bradyrhizobium elkanii]MCS3562735.1 hypothetical protein [Bradyrhizobium elkanii]MCW2147428.1 hypothetical protein [Bradyrhizobium elkanii]MCW2353488.1 hypothetical protein [Bradyrhizobium elkanii]MCW2371155.1 hypothetical protein [Bradyrhizobium elkanii]
MTLPGDPASMFSFDHMNGVEYGFLSFAEMSFVALIVSVSWLLIG